MEARDRAAANRDARQALLDGLYPPAKRHDGIAQGGAERHRRQMRCHQIAGDVDTAQKDATREGNRAQ